MPDNSNYYDLGSYTMAMTASSPEASNWVERGMVWMYGYNHEEAVKCFQKATDIDPECPMAWWGIALCIGPNYNKIWEMFVPDERENSLRTAHEALDKGSAIDKATPLESALIEALKTRYPTDPTVEEYQPWHDAFADAMRGVYEANRNNLDVASVFAEALMGRTPWALWDLETGGIADGASTQEARDVIERAMAETEGAWQHPGLLHMYIHLMEMSPTPELALPFGDQLTTLVPESGHLVHMATHIDVLCGEYQNVIYRNHQASIVDRKFTADAGAQNFYTVYRIHNKHFEAYGAMFLARKQQALTAAMELQELLPVPLVAFMPDLFEAFWGMKTHVMVRFGMWQALLDEPLQEDQELFCFTTALQRYGRTIALANLDRHEEAAAELAHFFEAQAAVPKTRFMFNNPAKEVLKIAAAMAQGELHYKAGRVEEGFDHLREAANLSDHLIYDEPWGWMQPPRHALAALLMEQERFDEAEEIYRADLGLNNTLARPHQHPRNVWALHGLHECLVKRGEESEVLHIKQLLDLAVARAEVPIKSSCYCRKAA